MPSKFEGDLLLITYLLNNTLEDIFERLNYQPPILIPTIEDTDKCYGNVISVMRRNLTTEEFEEEDSLIMTEEVI